MSDPDSLRRCPNCSFPVLLIAGKYRLVKMLGEGAFGQVFLARHVQLTRDAERAIKIVKSEFFEKPEFLDRFIREIQVTSSVSQRNEHIVRVYDDFGQLSGGLGYFYVMELLKGRELEELVFDALELPDFPTILHLLKQICKGLSAAHKEGIIHRDIKPENIVLIERDGDPHFVKIVDFGIAKPLQSTEESMHLTQGVLGTPLYMAPEQCRHGSKIDGRTDIYSLGAVLFELVVGHTPFAPTGKFFTPVELVMAHLTQAPPSPRVLRPDRQIPEAFEDVILKCLEKDPDKRFQTADELREAAELALGQRLPDLGAPKPGSAEAVQVPQVSATQEGAQPSLTPPSQAPPLLQSMDSMDMGSMELPPGVTSSRSKALVGLGLLLAVLLGGWWIFAKDGKTPQKKVATKNPPRTPIRKKAAKSPDRKAAPVKAAVKAQPGAAQPGKAQPGKAQPRSDVAPIPNPKRDASPATVRKKLRKRRRWRKRRPRPRAIANPKGCPPKPGVKWMRVKVLPSRIKAKILIRSGRGTIHHIEGGACVGFYSKSLTLRIESFQYRPCTLSLTRNTLQARWKLKLSDPDSPEGGLDDYCK